MTALGLNPDSRRLRIACRPPSGLSPPAAVADVISLERRPTALRNDFFLS
jgi:hypothetical protein